MRRRRKPETASERIEKQARYYIVDRRKAAAAFVIMLVVFVATEAWIGDQQLQISHSRSDNIAKIAETDVALCRAVNGIRRTDRATILASAKGLGSLLHDAGLSQDAITKIEASQKRATETELARRPLVRCSKLPSLSVVPKPKLPASDTK